MLVRPLAVTYCDVMTTSVAQVAQVIGGNARRMRLDAGVTLEQFAQAARLYGLPWTTGRVGDLEAGRVAPSVPTLYAVALALQHVTEQSVTLADLFAGSGDVQLNDKLTVDVLALADAMTGQPVIEGGVQQTLPNLLRTLASQLHEDLLIEECRESDTRLLRSIGVTPERGTAAMAELWGHTFSAERDRRAGPDANAQRKGQVSRQLKTELETLLEREQTKADQKTGSR
jgi:transcriptional regulator with XRE-family HTH domain